MVDHYVVRLHISMHDAHAVAVVQRLITMSTLTRVRLKKTIDNLLIFQHSLPATTNFHFGDPDKVFSTSFPQRRRQNALNVICNWGNRSVTLEQVKTVQTFVKVYFNWIFRFRGLSKRTFCWLNVALILEKPEEGLFVFHIFFYNLIKT